MTNDQLGIWIWSFIGHSDLGIGHLFCCCIKRLALLVLVAGATSCGHYKANPVGANLAGTYVLVQLHETVRIQRKPDWSLRVDAINKKDKSCTVAVISADEATPNVATLHMDGLLPDIPGRKNTQTGAIVLIWPTVVKMWVKLQ